MENDLIENDEDSVYTKYISGRECFHYNLKYKDQNIFKERCFIEWFNKQKKIYGSVDNICLCKNCNFFIYSRDSLFSYDCCNKKSIIYICTYCGNEFRIYSYCCARRGLFEVSHSFLLYHYECGLTVGNPLAECLKRTPFIFNFIIIGTIYWGFFLERKYKKDNYEFSNYEDKETLTSTFAIIIFGLFSFLIAIIYFFYFIVFYLIFIFIYLV